MPLCDTTMQLHMSPSSCLTRGLSYSVAHLTMTCHSHAADAAHRHSSHRARPTLRVRNALWQQHPKQLLPSPHTLSSRHNCAPDKHLEVKLCVRHCRSVSSQQKHANAHGSFKPAIPNPPVEAPISPPLAVGTTRCISKKKDAGDSCAAPHATADSSNIIPVHDQSHDGHSTKSVSG